MSELIPVNILIADRTYRIKVAVQDEEVVRKTLKLINEKIIEYKTQFAGKDMQDYLAMVVLWYATHQQDGRLVTESKEIEEVLGKMEGVLDRVINEK